MCLQSVWSGVKVSEILPLPLAIMGMESVCVSGYEGLLLLSSPSYPPPDYQLTYHEEQNCTLRDLNISIKSQSQNPFYNDRFEANSDKNFPKTEDMRYWVLAAFALILVRRFVERNIFRPLGQRLGIKDKSYREVDKIPCRNPNAVATLLNAYSSSKRLEDVQLRALAKETGLKQREIERWMRRRRSFDKPSNLVKFSESGWRFTTYVVSTSMGIACLWDKWWFWDIQKSWKGYPNHELPDEIWWYYLYGGGLYMSFLLTHFFDVKRKDFVEMLLHHIVTLSLLVIFFTLNGTRMAMVTLLLHDCSDVFLELAKMANYAKKDDLATGIFVGFTLVWIVTRLVIYPYKLLYQAGWKTGMHMVPKHIAYPTFGILLALFGLHIFWTYFICKVALLAIKSGPAKKDSRSSSESSEESDSSALSDAREEAQFPELAKYKAQKLCRRLSLQGDQITTPFLAKPRVIMKRISVEIM